MGNQDGAPAGPDLAAGVPAEQVPEGGMLAGRVGDDAVLVARANGRCFAVDAKCAHYGAPLADGVLVGETVRCPWHHAAFSVRTGQVERPPALSGLACWDVREEHGLVRVTGRLTKPPSPAEGAARPRRSEDGPLRIVIVGAGAAGVVAAETLRREGFQGALTLLESDPDEPVDRPNLSKDYLAGNAPEEWIPLRPPDYFRDQGIELRRGRRAAELDVRGRRVRLDDGADVPYDAVLLATGASPVRLTLPGTGPAVRTLRTLADSRAIVAAAEQAGPAAPAVVIGASFIGLEVAASLKTRGLDVHVVAPEKLPLERVMGTELGTFVKALHEEHGVVFHLEDTATAIGDRDVTLKSGGKLDADLVVIGVGVRPRTGLAEQARLAMDRGVAVNEFLETSAPHVFAAGDIARYPDPYTGERIRVEHWVHAERQGQAAARNMLGVGWPYDDVPFFWSAHYDVSINYVGHAEQWDKVEVDGDPSARDVAVRFKRAGRTLAVASIFRDIESLTAEVAMELEGNRQ
ncbi:MAG: FAD-dependent oxidoreductase [Gemmatimonadaceae bacterium]